MFKNGTGIDTSPVILANLSTMAKEYASPILYTFIDFRINPLVQGANSLGQITGIDPETNERIIWDNTNDLAMHLSELRPEEVEARGLKQLIKGMNKVTYDPVTCSAFLKTNVLGYKQQDIGMLMLNFTAYMLLYKALKMSGEFLGTPLKLGRNNKPVNFQVKEFELFKTGYMPLCIFSHFRDVELQDKIMECIHRTPLMEGIVIEQTYSIKGKAIADCETVWISKKSAFKFLSIVRPDAVGVLQYEDITLKLILLTLFEYCGFIKEADYIAEYGTKPFGLLPVLPIRFGIAPDAYGINRMYPMTQEQVEQIQ